MKKEIILFFNVKYIYIIYVYMLIIVYVIKDNKLDKR